MAKIKKKELTLEEKLEQALVPEDEWPYEVPDNWCWTKIGIVSKLYRGVSYKKCDAKNIKGDNDCLIMRGGNIKEGQIDLFAEDNVYINKSMVSKNQLVKKDDIIIVSSTGSTKVIGRAGISDADYLDVSFGAFLTLVRPIDAVCKRFVALYFQSDNYRNRIRKLASGVNINNIKHEYITETSIPLPPLAEQQRIVDRIESLFAKLNQAKELAQNALDTFETRKAAILHKAFTGELTAKWREKNGVEMESWIECELQDVCTVNPQKAGINGLDDNLSVTFVPMSAVSEVKGAIVDHIIKPLGEVRKGYTNFIEGDVLFAKITPCMENGKSAVAGKLINNIGFGSTEFYVLRCSEKIYNHYLYHLVRNQSFRDKAKAVMTGAVGQQRVPKSFLEKYPLHFPTLPEQKEIVRILDSLFEKEQKAKELYDVIEKIDLMKKAILARAFRGELGTNDPNEESAVELLKECLK